MKMQKKKVKDPLLYLMIIAGIFVWIAFKKYGTSKKYREMAKENEKLKKETKGLQETSQLLSEEISKKDELIKELQTVISSGKGDPKKLVEQINQALNPVAPSSPEKQKGKIEDDQMMRIVIFACCFKFSD